MKFGIIGNNDGPLRLLDSLQEKKQFQPLFLGLQKEVEASLNKLYQAKTERIDFIHSFNEKQLIDQIARYDIELLVNCFCNFTFKKLLDLPFEILNIHLSLLPKYRGRHPLHWHLINGENTTGFTIHKMTDQIDSGDILWQEAVDIQSGMSVRELRTAVMDKLEKVFPDFLAAFHNDSITPVENSDSEATYVARRFPEDSKLIEWNDSSKVYRKIRALRSEANRAYLYVDGAKIVCTDAEWSNRQYTGFHAPFISQIDKNKIQIVCGDGKTLWIHTDTGRVNQLTINDKIDAT